MAKRDKKSKEDNLPSSFLEGIKEGNEYLDIDKFKKIGEGGTHKVYEHINKKEFVIKIRCGDILSTDHKSYVRELNSKHEELKLFFGNDKVLAEKYFSKKFAKKGRVNGPYIFSVQERNYGLESPTKIDFSCEYAEMDKALNNKKDDYRKMNEVLLGDVDYIDEESYIAFNEKMRCIFGLIEKDNKFKAVLKEFLLNFKKYFKKTGNFLDFVGEENVIFFTENENWTYKIGSVLKNETRENVSESLRLLSQNTLELNKRNDLKRNLLNGLNLIRMLNVLGLKSGKGKIFNIQLNEKQLNNLSKVKF